jgi:HEAT repeat protein
MHLDNMWVRISALELAGKLDAADAAPVLVAHLDAGHAATRKYAAYLLGFLDTPEHAAAVLPLLDDPEVRGAAVRTLGKWGCRAAVPSIIPLLAEEKEVRRVLAANALGAIGDTSAVPALVEALGDGRFTVRKAAARALVALGADAEEALRRALPGLAGKARLEAVEVLGHGGSWRTRRVLRRLLNDPDPVTRRRAARSLWRADPGGAARDLARAGIDPRLLGLGPGTASAGGR